MLRWTVGLAIPVASVLLSACIAACIPKPGDDEPAYARAARRGHDELARGRAAAAVPLLTEAARQAPDVPNYLEDLARARALSGDADGALAALGDELALGWGAEIEADPAFQALREDPRFATVREAFARLRTPVAACERVATLDEPDLIPEGIAYDPVGRRFLLGSTYKRKIVTFDLAGGRGELADARSGLWSVLGLRVDAGHGLLYAASEVDGARMQGYRQRDLGKSGVFVFELRTGRLVRKTLAPAGTHLFNDLAVTRDGNVLVTDTTEGSVFRLPAGSRRFERITNRGALGGANGIALAADERSVYVAHDRGVARIELATLAVHELDHPAGVTLFGGDGLYWHRGSLIEIQNGADPPRIAQFELDAQGDRVVRERLLVWLDPNVPGPTTAVIVGDDLIFPGNTQLSSFDEHDRIWPRERLEPVRICRVSLLNGQR